VTAAVALAVSLTVVVGALTFVCCALVVGAHRRDGGAS
jgi:hypothetical protein